MRNLSISRVLEEAKKSFDQSLTFILLNASISKTNNMGVIEGEKKENIHQSWLYVQILERGCE